MPKTIIAATLAVLMSTAAQGQGFSLHFGPFHFAGPLLPPYVPPPPPYPPQPIAPAPDPTTLALQHALNMLMTNGPRLEEDGIMGPATHAALNSFQAAHHLPVTGA